jgi:hypothetical protein
MAYYVRPQHDEELTNKYLIQCYNLEMILCEYNIVARKIRNVKFKNDLTLQNSVFQTQTYTFSCALYFT